MKTNLVILASCATLLAPAISAAAQPTPPAADDSAAQTKGPAPDAAKKADAATDACAAGDAGKKAAKPPSPAASESVKAITRDTGVNDQPAPKPRKDTKAQNADC